MAATFKLEVNHMRNEDGISYASKAMIWTGMELNLNDVWEKWQLFPHL